MSGTDSETEGQLLIDESEDALKGLKSGRGRKSTSKKSRKKQPVKSAAKAKTENKNTKQTTKSKRGKNETKTEVGSARKSTRVRKQTRKHSPSPIVVKFPKAKLKMKNVTTPTKAVDNPPDIVESELKKVQEDADIVKAPDGNMVDIESVSDEDEIDAFYSSAKTIKKSPSTKTKTKKKRKKGIKLKLSLGKVLSSKVADDVIIEQVDSVKKEESPLPEESKKLTEEEKQDDELNEPIKPIKILRKFCSTIDVAPKKIADAPASEKPMEDSTKESVEYYSSSEEHKPLTLRLSVGKPKAAEKVSIGFRNFHQASPKAFPNIRRSWSVTPFKPAEQSHEIQVSTPPPRLSSPHSPSFSTSSTSVPKSTTSDLTPSTESQSTSPPFKIFSPGLQSLLDAVSVELNEQNFSKTDGSQTEKGGDTLSVKPEVPGVGDNKTPSTDNTKQIQHADEKIASDHQLPSMVFPKPKLNFTSRKRPRVKSATNTSPPVQRKMAEDDNNEMDIYDYVDSQCLSEKEQRRHDKKKMLNPDFVDPDTVLGGYETEPKKLKKAPKTSPLVLPKTKPLGSALLMPQMCSDSDSKPKILQMGSTCTLPSKSTMAKKPKKGMATAKQRLANKLKIGRSFTH